MGDPTLRGQVTHLLLSSALCYGHGAPGRKGVFTGTEGRFSEVCDLALETRGWALQWRMH
jgi:hypothetical protein